MKVVKSTGLVPVYLGTNANHVFGVQPQEAVDGWKDKTLFLFDIPEGIETIDIHMPGFDDIDSEAKKAKEPDSSEGVVVIPEDWEKAHWMTNNKLAMALLGDSYKIPEGTKKTEYDETVIREEIQRRGDAADNQS